jgi:hypothetical protein
MYRIGNSSGLAQALQAGAHWVRFPVFRWDRIEPVRVNPPDYKWTAVDEASLLNAQAGGMETIAIVHYTPAWAQKYPGSNCGPIKRDALDEFAQFLTALVRRYGAPPYNVRYWELWNEPDVAVWYDETEFGCWGETGDPYWGGGYFAEMLKKAYPAIKAADPDAQVLIGGLLLDCDPNNPPPGKDCRDSKFLEGILRNGGGAYFDIVSYHAYTYYVGGPNPIRNVNWSNSVTTVPEKTAFLRQVLADYGYQNKPLLNTEVALLCWPPVTNDCLEAQAMYIPRVYAEAMTLNLITQVYYALINEGWYYTGLLYPSTLIPKPAYRAFATASSHLGSARHQGDATRYGSQIGGYVFSRGSGRGYVDVIWSADGTTRRVSLPAGASAYDRYDNLLASSGSVQVGLSPVYIVRP